jgi:acetyltransferase-like isoleucine patch superfamily enzyme
VSQNADVWVHETAEISSEAMIGKGSRIWHEAQIREGARVGHECIVGKGTYIDYDVTIGDRCKLQNGVFVYHPATIEDGVFLGPGVIITNDMVPRAITPDGRLKSTQDWRPSAVLVRSGAAVGAGSIVLPGITIGRWALIGAGSVVTREVPDYGLAFGNPARIHGHVCACGRRFEFGADREYKCPTCGHLAELVEVNDDPDC